MRRATTVLFLSLAGCATTGHSAAPNDAPPPPATGALLHAHVWTGDAKHPWAEAVAWRGDRLVAVGGEGEVERLVGAGTKTIDAHGAMAVPGFIDAHVHFVDSGAMLAGVQLRDARSKDEFVQRIAAFARTLPPGAWITGGDWDHTHWGGALPDRSWVDAAAPKNPVWITRVDGHMALASSAAMRAAGVSRETPEVGGGTIDRDASGEPTGILRDNALALVDRAVPPRSAEESDRALDAAMRYVASNGITSVHSMGTWDDVATYDRAHERGALRTRIYAVVPLDSWERLRDVVAKRGRGDAWVRLGGLKGFADGSLGARTALMLAPFAGPEGGTGLAVTPEEKLAAWVEGADAAGLQVMIHAIGDRANREILDIYERVAKERGPRDRRFRIEHAQHLAPEDVPRFGALGVVASMQPYHCIDDGRWAEALIGKERAKTTYAFRTLLDTHATLAFGSDWHVAPATPIEGIYAAVTRRTLDDAHPEGWIPEQKITVDEALRAYTFGGAYASFEENEKGTLAPGKLADVTLVDRDLTAVAPETIRDAAVVATIVGGQVVYSK